MKLRRNGSHGHRVVRLALCAVLVCSVLFTGTATAGTDCETLWLETYDVSMDVRRKVYRVGDTATVDVTVTRKDTGTPVADAGFFAMVAYEGAYLTDVEKTDAAGHALVKLKLGRKYVDLGPADLKGWAVVTISDATCASVYEYGEQEIRNAFRVRD